MRRQSHEATHGQAGAWRKSDPAKVPNLRLAQACFARLNFKEGFYVRYRRYDGARRDADHLNGLKRLEYGYDFRDSVIENGHIAVRRDAGKLDRLASLLEAEPLHGSIGVGHTRWATHGQANQTNSHPHVDCAGRLVVVHNGIVENFLPLRHELQAQGHTFRSETTPEVIVHRRAAICATAMFEEAARKALNRLQAQGLCKFDYDQPDRPIVSRIGNAGVTLG
jgi:glucosamine--fructose-6-phosphate aminotransferase (isomerizing)